MSLPATTASLPIWSLECLARLAGGGRMGEGGVEQFVPNVKQIVPAG